MQAMSALLECLNQLPGVKLGTVVHVNPVDAEVLDHYARLGATRIVLVSADSDALSVLQRAAKERAGVRVVEAAVAPRAQEAEWLRFNVRELNGLQQAGSDLRTLYPRLKLLERLPLTTTTLQSLLAQTAPTPAQLGAQNLLVLETPGVEAGLLQGLSLEMIDVFGLILIRGARAGLFEKVEDPDAAHRWLRERFYRPATPPASTDGLWPVSLMCFDVHAAEQAAASRRIEELKVQVEQLCKLRDDQAKSAAERNAQIQALTEAGRQSDKLAQERLAQIEQLTQARDEQARALAVGQAQAQKLAQDRLAQLDVLGKARDEQAKLAGERQRRIAQLEAELTDLTARQGMLREELIKAEAHVELISDLILWEKVR